MPINRQRTNAFFRSFRHVAMGLILLVLGAVVAYYKRFGTIELSLWSAYGLAALMLVYGLFRIWRGVKDFQTDQNENNS